MLVRALPVSGSCITPSTGAVALVKPELLMEALAKPQLLVEEVFVVLLLSVTDTELFFSRCPFRPKPMNVVYFE